MADAYFFSSTSKYSASMRPSFFFASVPAKFSEEEPCGWWPGTPSFAQPPREQVSVGDKSSSLA